MTPHMPDFVREDSVFKRMWEHAERYWTQLWKGHRQRPPESVSGWEISMLTQTLYTAALVQALRAEVEAFSERVDKLADIVEGRA